MKRKSGTILAIIMVLIVSIAYLSIFGARIGDYRIKSLLSETKLGLDLKGGVYVVEEIQGNNVDSGTADRTIDLIKERIDKFGVVDASVVKEGTKRIRIEIPGMKDPQEALDLIGKTGNLVFKGPSGDEILTGKDIKDAYVSFDENNKPVVALVMTDDGKTKFSAATKKYIGQKISIYLDQDLLVDPTVQTQISEGSAVITNMKSNEEAKRIASLIKSGALPVTLKAENVRTIGPSLGNDALNRSILAGIVGISLVMLFMIIYYRLPGLVADFALTVYTILTFVIFVGFKFTLSLSGISGLLLSIGMAVDSNVLIFERIKEELKTGKTLNAALNAGFHRALSAVIDSNVTTIIAGVVLAMLGSSTVKGFAITLTIGAVSSMFTSVTVTRFLLKLFIDIKPFQNIKLYGA